MTTNLMMRYQIPPNGHKPDKREFSFEDGVTEKRFRFGYRTVNTPVGNEEAEFFPV
jgi:hypothetical protein